MLIKNFRTLVGVKNLTPYFYCDGIFYPLIGYVFQMHPLKTPKATAFTLLIGWAILSLPFFELWYAFQT